jgi:DNA-binding NarL/FixJ family response regulator
MLSAQALRIRPIFAPAGQPRASVLDVAPENLTVLIVEGHQLVATALAAIVEREPGISVVGIASTVALAVAAAAALKPDVVLVEFDMPDAPEGEAISEVLAASPSSKVITVTASSEARSLRPAVNAGAMGFVRKDSGGDELVTAVRSVARGEAHFSRAAMARIVQEQQAPAARPLLSAREAEVLQSLADGYSVVEIAGRLHLSQHTVRNHIRSSMGKLHVHTALEAVVRAARSGLIDLSGPAE